LREIENWAKMKSDLIVQFKSTWFEDIDDSENYHIVSSSTSQSKLTSNEENLSEEFKKIPALHIQMELCAMTLLDAMNTINEELNQRHFYDLTPLGAYIASHLFIDVVEGVNYLHSQNPPIIHRDIKMSNILLTEDMKIKISDFGLTREIKVNSNSEFTSRVGCPLYMAPELYKIKNYTEKVDVYSLGALLKFMFNIDFKT